MGAAVGDALGAPYEFQAPIPDSEDVSMIGGGVLGWDVGEWTDDTAMTLVLLEAAAAAADRRDLHLESTLDQIAREWYSWSIGTPDIGSLTSRVVSDAVARAVDDGHAVPRARDFTAAARLASEHTSQNAGNGSLMRTHAVALPYLHRSDEELAEAVLTVGRLTHRGPDVEEACLLWTFAVRHAIRTGELDIRIALPRLDPERASLWTLRIEEAESAQPVAFPRNGWVVHAFQGAWSAVHGVGPIPPGKFAQRAAMTAALESAVRAGYDTDTVASIAGGLLGAALGPKSVQPEWRRALFGWPGYRVRELAALAERVVGPPPGTEGPRVAGEAPSQDAALPRGDAGAADATGAAGAPGSIGATGGLAAR